MSRIGKLPIQLPAGVTVDLKDNVCTVKGPKGELTQTINPLIGVAVEDGVVTVSRPDDSKESRAQHVLYRALIHNMVVGVSTGFKKELEIVGVGYKAESKGQVLQLTLGFSHAIYLQLPAEVKVEAKSERNKNPLITLESADKQLLGQICAKIRSFRKPEPYKGKGIKFVGDVIRSKSGKTAAAKLLLITVMISKIQRRNKIKARIRGKISGTAARPRLCVFRSNKQIYAQVIDDVAANTVVSASSKGITEGTKSEIAAKVGEAVAKKAIEKGIETVVFDRNGFLFHGRIKSLADGARKGGLKF